MAGAFFDAERRTFYVLLRDDARGRIADAEGRRAMVDAVEQAWRSGADKAGFDLSLCIGFELPAGVDVIAVDRATARHVLLVMLRRPFSWRLGAAVVGPGADSTEIATMFEDWAGVELHGGEAGR